MPKYLDPKNDLLFKKIFGEHKELLISFLNAFLPLGDKEVTHIEYLSPEQVPITPLGKNSIVDVRCTENTGRMFIVEMQMEWSNIFRKRLLINGSKAVIKQIGKESIDDKMKQFIELEPVYIITVINSNFSTGIDWYHHLQIIDHKNTDVIIEGLDYILLELPKFKKETWSLAEKKMAVLWLRFFKEIAGYFENIPEELKSNKLISAAIEMCQLSALSPEEMDIYDRYEDQARWQASIKGSEDSVIQNKKTIEEKDKTIEEKDKENEILKKELEKLKKQIKNQTK